MKGREHGVTKGDYVYSMERQTGERKERQPRSDQLRYTDTATQALREAEEGKHQRREHHKHEKHPASRLTSGELSDSAADGQGPADKNDGSIGTPASGDG